MITMMVIIIMVMIIEIITTIRKQIKISTMMKMKIS